MAVEKACSLVHHVPIDVSAQIADAIDGGDLKTITLDGADNIRGPDEREQDQRNAKEALCVAIQDVLIADKLSPGLQP